MKTSLLLKIGFILPIILFIDYVIMVFVGCTSCLFGFGNEFYCGPYCLAGKIILGISAIVFLLILYPDIKRIIDSKKNGTTAQE